MAVFVADFKDRSLHVRNLGVVTKVAVQIAGGQVGSCMRQEFITADCEPEVHTRDTFLGVGEGFLWQEADDNREASASGVTGLAHVGREVRQGSIPGQHTTEDFLTGDAHYQRAKMLDQSLDTFMSVILSKCSNTPVNVDECVCGL